MEQLVDNGLCKSIGVSNFRGVLLMDLLRYAKVRPAALQIEHHPYLMQEGLVKYAQEEGIAVTAYSSFGPQSFLELDMQQAKDAPLLLEHPTIRKIADSNGKTPAQILLRWATQRNVAVIPKSNNKDRLAQNLDVLGFDLGEEDMKAIKAIDKGLRFNDPLNVSTCLFALLLSRELTRICFDSTASTSPSTPETPYDKVERRSRCRWQLDFWQSGFTNIPKHCGLKCITSAHTIPKPWGENSSIGILNLSY